LLRLGEERIGEAPATGTTSLSDKPNMGTIMPYLGTNVKDPLLLRGTLGGTNSRAGCSPLSESASLLSASASGTCTRKPEGLKLLHHRRLRVNMRGAALSAARRQRHRPWAGNSSTVA
jgi:hypothetical protein